MGKWIDRTALIALAAFGLYLLFLQAFGNIAVACALSFLCCSLLIRLRMQRGEKYLLTRAQAEAVLQKWAYGEDEHARSQLAQLLNCPESGLVYLAKHPTAAVGMGDVFGAWKSNRNAERLFVAAPCYADARARTFAKTLREPSVVLYDAAKLIPLIRRSRLTAPPGVRGKAVLLRLKKLFSELPYRRRWTKNLLTGLFLMTVYLFTGSVSYLILSMGMLLLAGIGIRART